MKNARLVPVAGAGAAAEQLAGQAEGLPTRDRRKQLAAIVRAGRLSVGLVPAARARCAAWVPESIYRRPGQCEKKSGLQPIGRLLFCRHHRQQFEIRGVLELGAGIRIVRGKG